MSFRCGHVVQKVTDLHDAVQEFTDVGFTVEWGSAPARAHNALVWFDEGPFVELTDVPRWVGAMHLPMRLAKGRAVADRFRAWAWSEAGFHDLAVETPAFVLDGARAELTDAGVATSKVLSGRRTRPDGQRVRYQFLLPASATLPFVVSAYRPEQRPERTVHPNGATGIAAIELDVAVGDRAGVDALAGGDRRLRVSTADRTAVHAVHLSGVDGEGVLRPSGTRIHGGLYVPAGA